MVSPVGAYYKGAMSGVDGIVIDGYDRCAPKGEVARSLMPWLTTEPGVGAIKAGGNYASDIVPAYEAKAKGYPIALYLDPLTHTTVEEFSTSNFIGIRGNTYITPESASVLDSVTNRVLAQCAQDMGLAVERRPVPYAEVSTASYDLSCRPVLIQAPTTRLSRLTKSGLWGRLLS